MAAEGLSALGRGSAPPVPSWFHSWLPAVPTLAHRQPPSKGFSLADVKQMCFIINRRGGLFNYQLFEVTKNPLV